MSPMAACAWAVRCHCSLAVALDAISYTASLGNGQEAMGQWFVRAASKVSSYAGLCCVPLLGKAPHPLLTHLLCCAGKHINTSTQYYQPPPRGCLAGPVGP